jgi:sulfite reductase (ferredoxin)
MSSNSHQGQANMVERIKAGSNYLRGEIAQELSQPIDYFTAETAQLLKHHGIFQQDDRDNHVMLGDLGMKRKAACQFMVRVGVPGGRLTSQQLLVQMELADRFGNGTLRITSRQDVQMHGLAKRDLRTVLRRIHEIGLTTMGASGDVSRNVVCCPAPYRGDPVRGQIQWMAAQIAAALAPRTPAYRDIWLDDAPSHDSQAAQPESEIEPLYGKTYLPRKFKIGLGLPGDNCADVYCQDVGLLAVCRDYSVVGYNVLVGGGMGVSPDVPDSCPALARRMAFVPADQIVDLMRAIVGVYRDFGNRDDRKRARLKHLVAEWGVARFKTQIEQYLGNELPRPEPDEVWDIDDHLGWREQGDGRWFYGLHVPNGRIQDSREVRLKSALREICEGHGPAIYLTPGQSMLLGDVYWEDRLHLEDHLRHSGLPLVGEISQVCRWANACVSLPTCSRALTEGERALPNVVKELEGEVARLGLEGEVFAVRMTGCANGCARPYNADVGIVGRAAGRYAIYLGGRRIGDRLGFLYRDGVPLEQLVAALVPVLVRFKQQRSEGETLGDFCNRVGCEGLAAAVGNA